jgi:predicted helicase
MRFHGEAGISPRRVEVDGEALDVGVAELRATDLLADIGATPPANGLGLIVTDTLDDPHAEQTQLGSGLEMISRSRKRAARVKAKTKVTVVIGNPPFPRSLPCCA